MKSFQKILLSLFSLIGLAFFAGVLSLLYGVPFTMDAAYVFITFYPWLDYFFAGFAGFMCVCFFLLLLFALFAPHKTNDLIVTKDRGRLMFSKQAVESAIRYSFTDVEGINLAKVRAKLSRQPEKTQIYVKLSVNDVSKLAGLSESVQKRIEAALGSSLGVTAKSIHIKVVEFNKAETTREESIVAVAADSPTPTSSRVE